MRFLKTPAPRAGVFFFIARPKDTRHLRQDGSSSSRARLRRSVIAEVKAFCLSARLTAMGLSGKSCTRIFSRRAMIWRARKKQAGDELTLKEDRTVGRFTHSHDKPTYLPHSPMRKRLLDSNVTATRFRATPYPSRHLRGRGGER